VHKSTGCYGKNAQSFTRGELETACCKMKVSCDDVQQKLYKIIKYSRKWLHVSRTVSHITIYTLAVMQAYVL